MKNEGISIERISALLGKKAHLFDTELHESIGSTNTRAKELARLGARAGTVVISETQSAGRGRMGRSFFSPCGAGIYMSVLLFPNKDISPSQITAFAGVCVAKAIERQFSVECKIKWVNDILISEKKVCGILAEAETLGNERAVALGIGINVKKQKFPSELEHIAGSVCDFSCAPPLREPLIADILSALSPLVENTPLPCFMDEYRRRSCLIGRSVYTLSEPSLSGLCVGIDDDGALLLQTEAGELVHISAGEVSVRY